MRTHVADAAIHPALYRNPVYLQHLYTMTALRPRLSWMVPAAVFAACAALALCVPVSSGGGRLPLAITADLLLTAPLAAALLTKGRKKGVLVFLRVFMLGSMLAGLLLNNQLPVLALVRRWIAPAGELFLIGFLLWRLRGARRDARISADPLTRCRAILKSLAGNERAAALLAGELTMPLYLFRRAPAGFSSGQRNGGALVLGTFLGLFVIETAALHLLLHIWKPVLAWWLTGAGAYSCLQLAAHIRALRVRPTVLQNGMLQIRNGLLGGEADIPLCLIVGVTQGQRLKLPEGALRFGLLPKLESPNLLLQLAAPVVVTRAFGGKRSADILAFHIDDAAALALAIRQATS
jgi:hypothetical protein